MNLRGLQLFLVVFIYSFKKTYERHEISKRFLIFPQSSPTRHQFIAGVGIPADLEQYSLTVGYVFKAQYYLPYNASMLRTSAFIRDLRQKRTANNAQKLKLSRWNVYNIVGANLSNNGLNGLQCVLRFICEYATQPVLKSYTILEFIVRILLGPSSTLAVDDNVFNLPYLEAERAGKSGQQCQKLYSGAEISFSHLLSIIPHKQLL